MAGSFEGKTGLVLGVANKRSIAWAIARRLAAGGARLAVPLQGQRIEANGRGPAAGPRPALTFEGEGIESNVGELASQVASPLVTACDVRSDDDVARVFSEVGET